MLFFFAAIQSLKLDKEKLLGVEAKKLLSDNNMMNDLSPENEEGMNYNLFNKKKKEKKNDDGKKDKFESFKRSLDLGKDKEKKEVTSKDALMTGQSSYHAPLSSILMKSDEESDKEREKEEISKLQRDNEEVSSLLNKAMSILASNKESLTSLTKKKKNEKKSTENSNKPRDLIDYKVIEVDDDNKK